MACYSCSLVFSNCTCSYPSGKLAWRCEAGSAPSYDLELNVFHKLICVRKFSCARTSAREIITPDLIEREWDKNIGTARADAVDLRRHNVTKEVCWA